MTFINGLKMEDKFVLKRNGKTEPFDWKKIDSAIEKAFKAKGEEVPELTTKIVRDTIRIHHSESTTPINIEDIQDDVVKSIIASGEWNVALSYEQSRENHKELRFIKERVDWIDQYMDSGENAASSSETDANANVAIKNVANIDGEVYKSIHRRIQRYRMRKKLEKMFPEVARQYEEDLNHHIIYTHDEASSPAIKNYCEAVSLWPLIEDGTGGMDGLKTTAPKTLHSFCGQLTNLTFLLSAQCKGAVAFGEFFNFLDYYCVKDFGKEYHLYSNYIASVKPDRTVRDAIHQAYQQIVYGWNQPAGNRSYQSPFTNISYYDENYWKALFGQFSFPDGTKPEWDRINWLQKDFMQWFNEERTKALLTFPVETMALLTDGKDVLDKDYKQFTAEMYAKGHSFFTYLSDNPNALASCCFKGDEVIKVYDKDSKPYFVTIKDFVESQTSELNPKVTEKLHSEYFIDSYSKENQSKEKTSITGVLKKSFTGKMIKIYISENNFIEVTEDHLLMVQNKLGEVEQISALEYAENFDKYSLAVDTL